VVRSQPTAGAGASEERMAMEPNMDT
jgi:hypothetical protein